MSTGFHEGPVRLFDMYYNVTKTCEYDDHHGVVSLKTALRDA